MKHLMSVCLMVFALAACSVGPAGNLLASPTPLSTAGIPSPTMTPVPTRTPTSLPTLTFTPVPSLTYTPLPTPTRFFTPTLTVTPYGFTASQDFGFTLVRTSGWDIEWASDYFRMINRGRNIFFTGSYWEEATASSLDKIVEMLRSPAAKTFINSQIDSRGQLTLADGTQAQLVILKGKNVNEQMVSLWVVYARQGYRTYVFYVGGALADMDRERLALQKLIGTIQLGILPPYGLRRDQTLMLLGTSEPGEKELDPALAQAGGASGLAGLLYSGLVRLTPELEIIPDLAESWQVSPDGSVYTFTLREDLAFHSGRPLTAADVAFSWERAADPATGSTTAAAYLGDIQGVREKLAGRAATISGVKVIDEQTLSVTLDGPRPAFLGKLTYPTSFVLDQDTVDVRGVKWAFAPNASGPYTLRTYQPGKILILERNIAYHRPASVGYIAFRFDWQGTPLSYFQAGEIDLADWFTKDEILQITKKTLLVPAEFHNTTSLCTSLIQMNNSQPPLDDPAVRKALALSIDRQRLIDQFFGANKIPAVSILPPAMPGFSQDLNAGSFRPAEARAALASSRYAGKLPKITLTRQGSATTANEYANALVGMWQKNLGIKVDVQSIDPESFNQVIHKDHGQMVLYGWCADYPDAENFLDGLYHSESEFNVAGYSNPEVDTLLEQTRGETDPTRRLDLYQKIEAMLLADGAAIPLDHNVRFALVRPGVSNFTLSPLGVRYLDLLGLSSQLLN